MQDKLLENISASFELMLPQNKETLLILAALQHKIDTSQIEEAFTQHNFEETVDEITELIHRNKQIQKENISKKLSQYFYTTLKKGNEYRYQLTVFAKELVALVLNEIQPQFDDVELIHTFERTLKLTTEDVTTIKKFEYWYGSHFLPSKKIILSHTENLQRLVDAKTLALRHVLKNNIENTKELINGFIEIFAALGKQTEGLTETLTFKQDVIENIKQAEKDFLDNKTSWEKYTKIRYEVEKFFDNIDLRVLSINDRILGSTSRLKTLYDTLRYKQLYKLKIEKFLVYLLKKSKHDKGEVCLPENIQKKSIPYFREKMIGIPNLNFSDVIPREVPEMEEDKEYKKLKEIQNMKLLNRQESISKWLERLGNDFTSGKHIVFDDVFRQIYSEEHTLEVPIEVCFGLIQKYGKDKDAHVEIETSPFIANEDLTTWKMKIHHLSHS